MNNEIKSIENDKLIVAFKKIIIQNIPTREMIDTMTSSLIKITREINELTKPIVDLFVSVQIKYSPFFNELGKIIENAKNNSDSILNWVDYTKKFCDYLWTMPYQMSSRRLKYIFEKVNSEAEFDNYMRRYYTNNRINSLFNEIDKIIPRRHKVLFEQIKATFYDQRYALSIIGIMSIIDELLSFFLSNKGQGARHNMLMPIINEIEKEYGITSYLLNMMILSNNINIIYEDIDFNKKIKIKSNKKARRNPSQHGRLYSNRKIDAIMLLNTIYNILLMEKMSKKYKGKLKYRKTLKEFYIEKK